MSFICKTAIIHNSIDIGAEVVGVDVDSDGVRVVYRLQCSLVGFGIILNKDDKKHHVKKRDNNHNI